MIVIFTQQELNVIDTCHSGDFAPIRSENEDGSIFIDVFDLYKDEEGFYTVKENGDFRYKDTLQNCLDYIYGWL